MTKVSISLKDARRLAINAQLLDGRTKFPDGKDGVARTIEHLGYIQIDTIAVIERAHHHTIWNRRPDYSRELLHQLQAVDRRIFEYWGHAMSYLPISDYRFYLPRMKRFADPYSKWEKERYEKYGQMMEPVLERIRAEGALSAKDFLTPGKRRSGGWWDWRPAKVALEMLFWRGDLMITERRNFQRVYDLTERVLPDNVDTSFPDNDRLGRFFVGRALAAHGLATEKEIVDHIDSVERPTIVNALEKMQADGEILNISVAGTENSEYYAFSDVIDKLSNIRKPVARVFLLSPFDNLIILRDRLNRLFNFDYALECYTPAPRRIHGYFVLPILYGDTFAGRLDAKAERKSRVLVIRKLVLEDGFKASDRFLAEFTASLIRFMTFNGCETIKLEKVSPAALKRELNRAIKQNI